jgi:hypothetical protein
MRTHARLRHLFQTLAALTVAPGALTGCEGTTPVVTPTDVGSDTGVPPNDKTSVDVTAPTDRGAPLDVAPQDVTLIDAGLMDTSPSDTGPVDVARDLGAPDTSPADVVGDAGAFDLDLCAMGTQYQPLAGVTTAMPVDYLEIRRQYSPGGAGGMVTAVAMRGTPCATASDRARCTTELGLVRATGWVIPTYGPVPPSVDYVVYTQGDRIGTVTTHDALTAFVAPIETPYDAALLAFVRGHRINCGMPNARAVADGFEIATETGIACGAGTGVDAHRVYVSRAGMFVIRATVRVRDGDPGCAIGRRPEGLEPVAYGALDEVGAYYAAAAHLEAASVYAFERLAEELTQHGAPAALIREALAARDDEVRHARMTARVAERHGARPAAARVAPPELRSLRELAIENAVEGCVRETFGALTATVQARRAGDASIARMMAVIADDETRHAALAWDVAAWAATRLSDDDNARVREARRAAIETLRREAASTPSAELVTSAGLPTAEECARLIEGLEPSLWAA